MKTNPAKDRRAKVNVKNKVGKAPTGSGWSELSRLHNAVQRLVGLIDQEKEYFKNRQAS